jgi:hypothetical protein
MDGLLVFSLIVAGLALLGGLAMRFGGDSRIAVSDTRGIGDRVGLS